MRERLAYLENFLEIYIDTFCRQCRIRDVMQYDFTKVQRRVYERGLTLAEISRRTGGKVHQSTIAAAFKRQAANPSTARAIAKALGVPFKDLLLKEVSVA